MTVHNADLIYSPRLAAVNSILTNSGLPEIDNVDGEEGADTYGRMAVKTLDETVRDVLSVGINDNTGFAVLHPDVNGHINIPSGVLWVRPGQSGNGTLTIKDGKIFDRINSTFKIEKPIKCEIRWNMAFDDLQPYVQIYCKWKAARDFQRRFVNDPQLDAFLAIKEQEALINFKGLESDAADVSLLDTPWAQAPLAGYGQRY